MSYDPSHRTPPRQERWPQATPAEGWPPYRDGEGERAGRQDARAQRSGGSHRRQADSRSAVATAALPVAPDTSRNVDTYGTAEAFDSAETSYGTGGYRIGHYRTGTYRADGQPGDGYADGTDDYRGYTNAADSFDGTTAGADGSPDRYGQPGSGYGQAAGGSAAGADSWTGNGYIEARNGHVTATDGYAALQSGNGQAGNDYVRVQDDYTGLQDGYGQTLDGYGQALTGYAGAADGFGRAPEGYPGGAYLGPGSYTETAYSGPGPASTAYSSAGYPDSGLAEAGYSGSAYSEPGYSEPGYSGRGYSEAGYSQTEYFDSGYSDPLLAAPDAGVRPGDWQADQARRRAAGHRGLMVSATTQVLATAVVIGVSTLAAGLLRSPVSPAGAMGTVFIDRIPAALRGSAVHHFGAHGRTVLLLGMYAVIAVVAIAIGAAARRATALGVTGVAAFTLVAAFVTVTRPTSHVADVMSAVIGGLAGVAALLWLVRASAPPQEVTPPRPSRGGTRRRTR